MPVSKKRKKEGKPVQRQVTAPAEGEHAELPDGAGVEVVSDSRYVVDALSKWIHGWRRKGWVTAQGTPVLNRDLIETLDGRSRALRVRYGWVRGHDGHAVNEIVDALAQGAARGAGAPRRDAVVTAPRSVGLLR